MHWIAELLVVIPALMLLTLGLVPSRWANVYVTRFRFIAAMGATVSLFFALAAVVLTLTRQSPIQPMLAEISIPVPWSIGVYFDNLAAIMTLLIAFIGFVIVRYSCRYLEGERGHGRFLKWMFFTLGSIMFLVAARNLVMFTILWMMTSYGLHQLLEHYRDRMWGIWAARKKFLISRLGDVILISALAVTYRTFGTFEYDELFAAAHALHENGGTTGATSLICVLFAIGAMTKSAQLPFHSWLPDTMEAPTPVSALMHAGIINAGGFLMIRLSPLITLSSTALIMLTIVGGATAILGAVVMMTQTSVKRTLAYSTIAQMGFMMLQCGLGAFSAALLHLVAHSAYKAHTFLRSGSVLEQVAATRLRQSAVVATLGSAVTSLLFSAAGAVVIVGAIAWAASSLKGPTPSGMVLTLVLGIAVTQLLLVAMNTRHRITQLRAIAVAVGATLSYFAAFSLIDAALSDSPMVSSVMSAAVQYSWIHIAAIAVIVAGLVGILLIDSLLTVPSLQPKLAAFYVHAANAFYLETAAQRVTTWFWRKPTPQY